MQADVYSLGPAQLLRSVRASRDTLGKSGMKILEVVDRVRTLTENAPGPSCSS